jgi:hypothetical protein
MAIDKNHVRDCYAQLRSIRRLMAQVTDDLGDLSLAEARDGTGSFFAESSDALTDMEYKLHGMQEKLEKLSRAGG